MANTLTNLIPDVYAALDVVSRELIGFIPAAQRDPSADRVALNQNLRIHQTNANTAGRNITPAMAFPATADQTVNNRVLTITKTRAYPFNWTGEEQKSVDSGGPGYLTIQQDMIAQAIRGLVNEMETDLANAAVLAGSRATGTAGTTPFASNLTDFANSKKILDDNGAPQSDRQLVLNTTSSAALRALTQLTKANEAADTTLLRQGTILDVMNFQIRESAQFSLFTKGTGSAYTTTAAGFAVGTTVIPLITGSGTILNGDIVTFAGDTNKYEVLVGISAPGSITLQNPGLRQAIPAAATAVTVGGNYTPNAAFSRNALLLASRLPAVPKEGDLAIDRQTVTDPRSGIALEVAAYPGYRMVLYEIAAAWGVLAVKPEHIAILLS